MSPPSPEVITLGRRLNVAESKAVRQTRVAIRRLRRARPEAELIATGCAATIDPAGSGAMAEVDRVVANAAKLFPAGSLQVVDATDTHLIGAPE